MSNLSDAIKQKRKELGLSQAALADLANCGPLFIHDLEQGKSTVRLNKLLSVLTVLNLQLELTDGAGGIVVR